MKKLIYALVMAATLVPQHVYAGAKDNVYFVGPNNETAVEYLLRADLTDKERNKWKADKKVYRYTIFTAVAFSTAGQKLRQAHDMEIQFYNKLKVEDGGVGGVLDVALLAQLESARHDFASFMGEIAAKTPAASAPEAFAATNKSFNKYSLAKQDEEKAKAAALTSLITVWRDKLAKSKDESFPVRKMFELLNNDTAATKKSSALFTAWKADFRKDCETYFGRKMAAPQPVKSEGPLKAETKQPAKKAAVPEPKAAK